jgi:hypothetical protein
MHKVRDTRLGTQRRGIRTAVFGAVFAAIFGFSSVAAADVTATVLGVRSLEGDDAFANGLSSALRVEAGKIPGWKVSDRAVSITQMGLAYGCEEPDVKCLTEIAAGIGSDLLIYGTVRRTGVGERYNFVVILSLFNHQTLAIDNTVVEPSVPPDLENKALASVAAKLVDKLVGTRASARAGSILLRVNLAQASVRVDGKPAGITVDGELTVKEVPSGKHQLEVVQSGYEPFQREIAIPEGGQVSVQGTLVPVKSQLEAEAKPASAQKSHTSLKWLGFTLIGLSAASVAGMAISWAVIKDVDQNSDFQRYRESVGATINGTESADVCKQAKNDKIGHITTLCNRASLFETLQYVFLGTAIAGGVAGTYILISEASRPEKAPQQAAYQGPKLTLWPTFSAKAGQMTAQVTF